MKKEEIKKRFKGKTVAIIGDLILDRFVFGSVKRISPEAPVPVVEVLNERETLGGSANVANNIKSLGGVPILIGAVGEDNYGREFISSLKKEGIDDSFILRDRSIPTVVKTRIIAHHQQVCRVDREKPVDFSQKLREKLLKKFDEVLKDVDAVVVSDYAKGTFSKDFLLHIGEMAKKKDLPYIVDPKPVHFPYPYATIVTPNRGEAEGFLKREFQDENIFEFLKEVMQKSDWKAILLTLGEKGMALYERGKRKFTKIDARKKEVYDVTGAGDTVVSIMALSLASSLSFFESANLANIGASVVVSKLGTATCSIDELLNEI